MPRRSHKKARVRVTVIAALDANNVDANGNEAILEYWWSTTPEWILLQNPDKINEDVTVEWEIRGKRLEDNKNISNFGWDDGGGTEGVSMNKDVDSGPVWDDAWGVPKKSGQRYSLTVTANTPPTVGQPFKYSLFVKVEGKTIVLDPEVEYDPEM